MQDLQLCRVCQPLGNKKIICAVCLKQMILPLTGRLVAEIESPQLSMKIIFLFRPCGVPESAKKQGLSNFSSQPKLHSLHRIPYSPNIVNCLTLIFKIFFKFFKLFYFFPFARDIIYILYIQTPRFCPTFARF